jgi:hypothetical protein
MIDSFLILAENGFHIANQFFPDYNQVVHRGSQALCRILTPLGTAKVDSRIDNHLSAMTTFQLWLVLEELFGMATLRTLYLEDIIRFPEPLVLSGASYHL